MKSFRYFFLAAAAGSLYGLPSGMQVIAGQAEIGPSEANKLLIQSGDHTILQWDQFSIGPNEIAQFLQTGANSALLNRVMGGSISEILGLMESNGNLYLINPNGVLIGPDARIESAGFLASTLDILNEDFLANQDLLFAGDSNGAILNLGTISCPHGDVALFARFVKNEGEIQAREGSALLATGPEILLKIEGKQRIYIRPDLADGSREDGIFPLENTGNIEALSVELQSGASPYLQAIRGAGSIKGLGTVEENGIVYLVAQQGYTEVSGSLAAKRGDAGGEVRILGDRIAVFEEAVIDAAGDAGGGTVFIGGSFQGNDPSIKAAQVTRVQKGALITADALASGNGGQVVLWSENTTGFYGSITAQGGPLGGDGGMVEVSGPSLAYSGKSSTLAPFGKIGTLLLDPNTITISTAATAPAFNDSQYYDGNGTAAANILNTDLVAALNLNNVTIQTSDATVGGTGDIVVQANITVDGGGTPWNQPTQLTMRATSQILINTPGIQIANTYNADNFTAMYFIAGQGNGVPLSGGSGIVIEDGALLTDSGDIYLSGVGGHNGSNNIGVEIYANTQFTQVSTGSFSGAKGSIFINGRATGETTSALTDNAGVLIHTSNFNTALVSVVSGNIEIYGNCQNSSAAMMNDNVGVYISSGGEVSSAGNDPVSQIVITGIGGPGNLSGNDGIRIGGPTSSTTSVTNTLGSIYLTGTGNGTGASTNGILITTNGSVQSFNDAPDSGTVISLTGTLQGTTSGIGVQIVDSPSGVTSVDSNIYITGIGGASGSNNMGVELLANTESTLVSTQNASIFITGQATPDVTSAASNNFGVAIHGSSGSMVTTGVSGGAGGDITIVGSAQASSATSMTQSNIGVLIDSSATVSAQSGVNPETLILIKGTGGPGQAGAGSTLNHGIQISNSSLVSSASGSISLVGIGNGQGTNNNGILIAVNSQVSAGNNGTGQTVSLEGTGSGGANGTPPTDFNCGVSLQASANGVNSTGSNISIVGTGSPNALGTDNHGIFIGTTSPGATTSSSIQSTTTGNISLTGYGGAAGTPNCSGVTVQFTPGSATASTVQTNSGNIAIHGEASGTGLNPGILLTNTGSIVTDTGAIALTGIASGTGGTNNGVAIMDSAIISTDAGEGMISITGQGSLQGDFGNNGVLFSLTTSNPIVVPGLLQTLGHDVVVNGFGGGAAGGGASSGIQILNNNGAGAVLTLTSTGSGSINLSGTGAAGGTGANHGIQTSGGTSQTFINVDTGDLYITGISGNTIGGQSDGMQILNGTFINTVSGNLVLYGESLASASTSRGCFISNSTINATSTTGIPGLLSITGFGSVNSANGNGNHGIFLTNISAINSMQHDMYLTGVGGGDTGGGAGSNVGVQIDIGTSIVSTDLTPAAASLYLEGTGGLGGGGANIGFLLSSSASATPTFITIGIGDIFITGTGNGSGANSYGVQLASPPGSSMAASIATTASAGSPPSQISINGVGSLSGSSGGIGVYLQGAETNSFFPSISSVAQPITIVAQSGLGTNQALLIDNGEISMGSTVPLTIQTLGLNGSGGDFFLQNIAQVSAATGGTSSIQATIARDFQMINGGQMSANSLNIQTGRDLIIQADTSGGTIASTAVSGLQTGLTNPPAIPNTVELNVGGNLTMTGGSGTGQGAVITAPSGNALILVQGNLTVQAGSATNSFAQIGGLVGSGNLLFPLIGGNVVIGGGNGAGPTWGSIGYGNGLVSFSATSVTGNITFEQINGNVTLQGGPGVGFAQIGHINPPAGPAFDMSGNIFINAAGNILLNPAGAAVGTYAQIGHGGPNGGVATFNGASAVQVFAGGEINMAGAGGTAIIVNPSTNASAAFPHSGSITLVADNDNPLNPYAGGTSFSMNNTSVISNVLATGGQVRIYTSAQDTSAAGIPAAQPINGALYSPSPPGTNTNQEMFNLYYGAGQFNGPNFVIYYKLPIVLNPVCPVCPVCTVCPTCPSCVATTTVVFFPELYIIAVANAQLTDLLPVDPAAVFQGSLCSKTMAGGRPVTSCSPGFTRFESFLFQNTVDRMLPLSKE